MVAPPQHPNTTKIDQRRSKLLVIGTAVTMDMVFGKEMDRVGWVAPCIASASKSISSFCGMLKSLFIGLSTLTGQHAPSSHTSLVPVIHDECVLALGHPLQLVPSCRNVGAHWYLHDSHPDQDLYLSLVTSWNSQAQAFILTSFSVVRQPRYTLARELQLVPCQLSTSSQIRPLVAQNDYMNRVTTKF
eukprot:scaffold19120_cov84-Skeletonema_dohrnii-CCMP3373.AAC.1